MKKMSLKLGLIVLLIGALIFALSAATMGFLHRSQNTATTKPVEAEVKGKQSQRPERTKQEEKKTDDTANEEQSSPVPSAFDNPSSFGQPVAGTETEFAALSRRQMTGLPAQPTLQQTQPAVPVAPEAPTAEAGLTTPQTKPVAPSTPPVTPRATYTVRSLNEQGAEISRTDKQVDVGAEVTENAPDLFGQGYELFDKPSKTLTVPEQGGEITFRYGKARELMTIEEFVRHEVNYDYPLTYRNIDFRGRQKDLEDFVIKKIYEGARETGVFYGTKDQGEEVRKTMLNGSLQGGYTRYMVDMAPLTPRHVEGDKYAINIDLRYHETEDNMKLGEKEVSKFYETYGKRGLSDVEKAKVAYDWLMKNVKLFIPPNDRPEWFMNSGGYRRVHFPASAMLDKEGVCLTYAMTYARLVERMGLDVRVAQGYFGTQKRSYDRAKEMLADPDTTTYRAEYFNHSWNLVKIDGQWYHVDPFHEINMIGTLPASPYHYFLRSDDFMSHSQVTVKHRRYPARKMDVYKVWNVHRMHAAPQSYAGDVSKLPNLVQ